MRSLGRLKDDPGRRLQTASIIFRFWETNQGMNVMNHRIAPLIVLALVASLGMTDVAAQGGLNHLSGPKGGDIVYGPVTGVDAVPAAMGAVLRMLHGKFGAKPEVGRVVEARGSGASTLHFSLQPTQGPAVAGLIVVARSAQGFEAGVVYDDAKRLNASLAPMMERLMSAWHPEQADQGASSDIAATAEPAGALHTVTLNDNSARVGLPQGWRIDPQSSQGTILARGPRGEFAALGAAYFVMDISTQQGRAMQLRGASMRGTMYATALYYPSGQPLGRTFVDIARMTGERAHAPPMPMSVDSEQPLSNRNGMRCARLRGEGGLMGGHEPARFDTVFCTTPPVSGSFMALAYHVAAPAAVAAAQGATLLAMRDSFQANDAVIQAMAGRMAAPGIEQIHAIGRLATERAAEADRTRIGMRNSFEANSNTQDRLAQNFSNVLRDQSVVVDHDGNSHGTTWNSVADAMVKNNPQRYSIVSSPGYWKGIDY